MPSRVLFAVALWACCSVVLAESARAELPRVYIQRGERFLAMGKYPAAMANYSKVVDCCSGTMEAAEAHNDIGVIHARQGDMDKALRAYEAALTPVEYPLARFNLGKAHAQLFAASGDTAHRAKAVENLRLFASYLDSNATFPAVVSFQKDEIIEYVNATLNTLEAR